MIRPPPKSTPFPSTTLSRSTQVIAAGTASTTALEGSTEQEQFAGTKAQAQSKHGPNAACQPILGECPSVIPEIMPMEERSEEHTLNSSHSQISYAVFCLKKK